MESVVGIFDAMKAATTSIPLLKGNINLSYFSDEQCLSIPSILEKLKKSFSAAELAEIPAYGKDPTYLRTMKQIEPDDRIAKLHEVATFLMSLPIAVDNGVYVKNDMKETFLKHIVVSKDLLIAGPPGAGEHSINEGKASEWVAAQKSTKRKDLARKLLSKIRYISHHKMLEAIKACIPKVAAQCDFSRPVVFLTGLPKKSNYYISLLFAHFWLDAGYPIDFVLEHAGKIDLNLDNYFQQTCANLLDIDDMAYSGTQTFQSLSQIFNIFVINPVNLLATSVLVTDAYLLETTIKDKKYTHKDAIKFYGIPHFFYEYVMREKMRINYIICRPFLSTQAFELYKSLQMMTVTGGIQYILPSTLVFHEIILSTENSVGKKNAENIATLFQENPGSGATTVYFNHKIADSPSTFLLPIANGRIPGKFERNGYIWPDPSKNLTMANNGVTKINGPTEYKRFVKGCMNGPQPIAKYDEEKNQFNLNDKDRCPFAWYKKIDYNAGTYTPPERAAPSSTSAERRTRRSRKTGRKTRRRH